MPQNPKPKTRFLCIFATARTGSNRLQSLLENCEGLNLKGELFGPEMIRRWTDEERQAMVERAGTENDEDICAWRTKHPFRTLNTLYKAGGKKPLVIKVFPQHLSREAICRDFFSRDDIAYALLRRRPIESFISLTKARKHKAFVNADTTDFRPAIDIKRFIPWAMLTRDWYNWLAQEIEARGLPCVDLSYESQVGLPDAEEALLNILGSFIRLGFPPFTLKEEPISSTERQDRSDRFQDRIQNWEEFVVELRSDPAYAHLLPWAVAES